jgi:glutathione S-transferase
LIKLFHSPDSRSSRFIWLLDELGVEHEVVYCTIKRRSGQGERDSRNPHPEGRVPAILDGDVLVTEQLAIALYLTDRFPGASLGAGPENPDRAAYLSWLAFWASEADPAYNTGMLYGDRLDPMSVRDRARVTARVLEALGRGPYLLGDRFSAVDVLISGPFEWDAGLAAEEPKIIDWLCRMEQRPAAQRARARDMPPAAA